MVDRILIGFKISVLEAEIKVAQWKCSQLVDTIKCIEDELAILLPSHVFCNCKLINKIRYEKVFKKT